MREIEECVRCFRGLGPSGLTPVEETVPSAMMASWPGGTDSLVVLAIPFTRGGGA